MFTTGGNLLSYPKTFWNAVEQGHETYIVLHKLHWVVGGPQKFEFQNSLKKLNCKQFLLFNKNSYKMADGSCSIWMSVEAKDVHCLHKLKILLFTINTNLHLTLVTITWTVKTP